MTNLSDVTIVKFIDWIKDNHKDSRNSFEDIINDEELLLKYADEAIYFNVLGTFEIDIDYFKENLKKSLNDYVDTFINSEDLTFLFRRYIYENTEIDNQYQYISKDIFYELYHYFTFPLKEYLNYEYIGKENFRCTNAKVLVDSLHAYLKN